MIKKIKTASVILTENTKEKFLQLHTYAIAAVGGLSKGVLFSEEKEAEFAGRISMMLTAGR